MGSELQVQNYSGWLQMEKSAGLPQKTTVGGGGGGGGGFIWRTTAMNNRPRSAVVGFIWSTLLVVGFAWETKVASFRWRNEIQQWAIHGVQQWLASNKER